MITWIWTNWSFILVLALWVVLWFMWAWPRRKDGPLMNLQEAMNYYDRYSDQMSALQTAPLSVMIFFGWLWALLARRKRK